MPIIGPIFIQLRTESTPCTTFDFHWCILDITEKGYVTQLRVANTEPSAVARPDESRFSEHPFDKTVLTVFDPEKATPNHVYYLYINEDRKLLRFRLKDQASFKLMPGESYNKQGFLVERPLSNADHLGLSGTSHALFIHELSSVKEIFLSQYQRIATASVTTNSVWLTDRMTLTVNWDAVNIKLRTALTHGGFLSDWERLKNEAPTSSDYCFALIALLQHENIEDIIQDLHTNTQNNLSIIQQHLRPNTLLQLSSRWLNETSLEMSNALKRIYSSVMKLLYMEFSHYQKEEESAVIQSFSEERIHNPVCTITKDTSAEKAYEIACSIYNDMKNPNYLVQTALDEQREIQTQIIALLEREDRSWLILKQLEVIFDAENDLSQGSLDQELRMFSERITNWRNTRIKERLKLESEKCPLIINLDLEFKKTIHELILTTDDLVAALKGAKPIGWQLLLMNILNFCDPSSHFIKTPEAFARVVSEIREIKEQTAIFKSRPFESWLAMIKSIKDLKYFVDTVTDYQIAPFLDKCLTTLDWPSLLSCNEDIILLAQTVNSKYLAAILQSMPQTTLATFFQTPNALKSLIYSKMKRSNFDCIVKSLPDQQRITAVSTLDKYNRLLSVCPNASIYLTNLSVSNWIKLLEEPSIWGITTIWLEKNKRIAILEELPKSIWLSIIKFEVIPEQQKTSTAINDIYCCLLRHAQRLGYKASTSITDWKSLQFAIDRLFRVSPSLHFFSPTNALYDTSWIYTSRNISELKLRIFRKYSKQDADLNMDSYLNAFLCIDAYEASNHNLGKRKLKDFTDYQVQPPPSA